MSSWGSDVSVEMVVAKDFPLVGNAAASAIRIRLYASSVYDSCRRTIGEHCCSVSVLFLLGSRMRTLTKVLVVSVLM